VKTQTDVVALLLCSVFCQCAWASATPAPKNPSAAADKKEGGYDPDIDLKNAPVYYRKRVLEFRNLLRKEASRDLKVRKAVSIARNPKSEYFRDAIEFLGTVRSKEAVPPLIEICKDIEAREFALHALGEIRDARAVPTFIEYLSDPSENVRGNAHRALESTTNKSFVYRYDDPPDVRSERIAKIRQWWGDNAATFKVQEASASESAEAEGAWQRFGRQYLRDLNR
jgi:hypothetical protein